MGKIVGPIALSTVGIALGYIAFMLYGRTRDFLNRAIKAPAKVLELREVISDGSTTYAPIYEYHFEDKVLRFESKISSNHPPRIGSDAFVYIDPDDPSRVSAGSWSSLYFSTLMFGIFGMTLFLTGILWLLFEGK